MSAPRLLIADDQPEVLRALSVICSAEGYEVVAVTTPAAALANIGKEDFDVVLIDLNYRQEVSTGEEGLELIKQIGAIDSSLPVVVMTAYASIQLAVEAIRLGAKDFLQKPWENERLLSILRTQLSLRDALRGKERLEAENRALRSFQVPSAGFVAKSQAMRQVREIVEQVAPSDANVMITGENGTGKNVVARMLHENSLRSAQPLITVNMGGLADGVFESEMFGHVKGAFTDARTDRVGRFELADNGTLFLDEIANMSAAQQAKLLRVLETGEFERVGSSKTRRADVRILTATNADLEKEIESGRFREDLYFRLNTIQIVLPPLRDRPEDVQILAEEFLMELKQRYRKQIQGIRPDAIAALRAYLWPGNVRELRHVMERAVLLTRSDLIQPSDLGIREISTRAPQLEEMDLDAAELHLINRALARHNGNALLAAKDLGLSRSAFYRRLQKRGINPG
ncbi:MAG TPA: sigma-54 dependent transcriptional regulator [Chthoniobacterales bacterium]|jgi:DNA-binding NtrC family response regulator|nr:sigma-54 dependent transcriptional regulator [Chthoniobacterales bacterium]